MAVSGCPAFIPEGRTSFTRTRRGAARSRVMRDDEARDKSISNAEWYERIDSIDFSTPTNSGLVRVEEYKRNRRVIKFKKETS